MQVVLLAVGVKQDIRAEMKDKASGGRVGYGSSFSSIHWRPLARSFVSERCSLKNARWCYPPRVCSGLCLWRLSLHPTQRSWLGWLILILNHNAFLILFLFFCLRCTVFFTNVLPSVRLTLLPVVLRVAIWHEEAWLILRFFSPSLKGQPLFNLITFIIRLNNGVKIRIAIWVVAISKS